MTGKAKDPKIQKRLQESRDSNCDGIEDSCLKADYIMENKKIS